MNLGSAVRTVARWLKTRPATVRELLTCLSWSLSRPSPTSPSASPAELSVAPNRAAAGDLPEAGRLWASQWGLHPGMGSAVLEQALEAVFAYVATVITMRFLQLLEVQGIPEEPSAPSRWPPLQAGTCPIGVAKRKNSGTSITG